MKEKESDLIRQAFDFVFDALGERANRAIIEELRRQGIFLDDPSLTLPKLFDGLRPILGDDATALAAERLILKLDELHEKKKS